MNKRTYTNSELGMLFGIFIGGSISVILFAITGNALYFTAVGVGLVFGLLLGAGLDSRRTSGKDK